MLANLLKFVTIAGLAIGFSQAIAQSQDIPFPQGAAQQEASEAAARAEAGISGNAPASALVLPYASELAAPDSGPSFFGSGNLKLSARLSTESPLLRSGLTWRIFGARADDTGTLPLIATASGGPTSFDLEPGDYLVHVAYGRAGATMRVDMSETERLETLILDAGGLLLNGIVGNRSGSELPGLVFDIHARDDGAPNGRKLIVSDVRPGKIVPLKQGPYHVVSRYGDINAVVRADVQVNLDQLTELTVYHKAARLNFRLVTAEGGDALASTMWSILTPGGDTIAESVGAVPQFVLAEGEYVVVAQHADNVYNRSFSVESGLDRSVEVVALLAPTARDEAPNDE